MGAGAFAARMGQDKNKNSANGLARFYDYFYAFFWGLAVLVAFIGYGRLLSHLCGWAMQAGASC